jgi:hypothetical protein
MKHGVGRASIFICLLLGKGPERERERVGCEDFVVPFFGKG